MKTKEEITEYLVKTLRSVYCDNCKHGLDDDFCDECHRKSMNWGLDESSAEAMAEKILGE